MSIKYLMKLPSSFAIPKEIYYKEMYFNNISILLLSKSHRISKYIVELRILTLASNTTHVTKKINVVASE